MPSIFLSYRREDSSGFAGRLADSLESEFGRGTVFRDVDDMEPGADFIEAIHDYLRKVDALLVVIGPHWLDAARDGRRRLEHEEDFVRLEIEAALEEGKTVIPILVGGAAMPAESDLPASIAALARRHALVLDDNAWASGVGRLKDALRPRLPASPPEAPPPRGPSRPLLAAGAALLALVLVGVFLADTRWWGAREPGVIGAWTAQVAYDWGVTHEERFEFRLAGREITGTASFLGQRRTLEEVAFDGTRLTFRTRTRAQAGRELRELRHHYDGIVEADAIRFTLQSEGGFSDYAPVEFVARRAER